MALVKIPLVSLLILPILSKCYRRVLRNLSTQYIHLHKFYRTSTCRDQRGGLSCPWRHACACEAMVACAAYLVGAFRTTFVYTVTPTVSGANVVDGASLGSTGRWPPFSPTTIFRRWPQSAAKRNVVPATSSAIVKGGRRSTEDRDGTRAPD